MPADLETVILKAMAKDPRDRYPTAQELADDLRRFATHQPILARKPTLATHAQRWVQRNAKAALSGLAVSVLVLTILAALVSWLLIERSGREFALQALQQEKDAKSKALERTEVAEREGVVRHFQEGFTENARARFIKRIDDRMQRAEQHLQAMEQNEAWVDLEEAHMLIGVLRESVPGRVPSREDLRLKRDIYVKLAAFHDAFGNRDLAEHLRARGAADFTQHGADYAGRGRDV